MNFTLSDLVGFALDEAFVMDADGADGEAASVTLPPDLVVHDRKYHHGHYNGGKCKYREQRAAMFGITENDPLKDDQMDKLNPEDVDGEEIDKVDAAITGSEKADSSRGWHQVSENGESSDEQKSAAYGKLADDCESWAAKAPNDFVKNLLLGKAKAARAMSEKLGDGGAIRKMLDFARTLGYEFDPAAIKGILKKVGVGGSRSEGESGVGLAERAVLEKKRKEVESDIDSLKSVLSDLSPEGADELKKELSAYEAYLSEINDALAGKGYAKTMADAKKAIAKAVASGDKSEVKCVAKEIKKQSLREFQLNQKGATCALDIAADIMPGKTFVLDSQEFKDEMSHKTDADKIFAVSDFHNATMKGLDVSKFGTVMMAGDWTKNGYTSHKDKITMEQAVVTGNEWLQDHFFKFCNHRPNQQFVLVAGNHDHFLADPSAKQIQWPSNVSYLDDSETIVNGMRVYGTPYCEKRKGDAKTSSMTSTWARQPFELDDADAKAHYDKIPSGLDILIVHQPPKCEGFDGDMALVHGVMTHCGSESLAEAIKRAKPKLVLCGHLHDSDHRPFRIGDSVIMNTAYVSGRDVQSYTPNEIGVERGSGAGDCGFFVDGENNHILGQQGK